jgi:hypothetical protein
LRFTRDVDLVLQLAPENIASAFGALGSVKPPGSVAVRFVSIPSLIRMKEIAGRPQDKIDIDYLRKLADAGK